MQNEHACSNVHKNVFLLCSISIRNFKLEQIRYSLKKIYSIKNQKSRIYYRKNYEIFMTILPTLLYIEEYLI